MVIRFGAKAISHPGDMITTSLVRGPRPGPVGRLLRRLLVIVPQASGSSSDGWLMLTVSQPSCWDGSDENSAYISKRCYALGHRMMPELVQM